MADSCCEQKCDTLSAMRSGQARILKAVLAINLAMFVVEFVSGIRAKSTSLLGDSLDMLGDATVYAFSLYVLNRGPQFQAYSAILKGLVMTGFGIFVLTDALAKVFTDIIPSAEVIGIVGTLALTANGVCLWLLWAHRKDDINMRSVWICSRNDIVANIGVILAAIGVWVTGSKWADIVVGGLIAALFLSSALTVLREAFTQLRQSRTAQ
jgi:cation diffusion facilitator family transporter